MTLPADSTQSGQPQRDKHAVDDQTSHIDQLNGPPLIPASENSFILNATQVNCKLFTPFSVTNLQQNIYTCYFFFFI